MIPKKGLKSLPFKWIRFKAYIRKLSREGDTPGRLALAIGMGVFIGLSPFFGMHALISVAIAAVFGLNKPLAFLASNVSIPPIAIPVAIINIQVGHRLRGEGWQVFQKSRPSISEMMAYFGDWTLGWVLVGSATATVLGLFVWAALAHRNQRRQEKAPKETSL